MLQKVYSLINSNILDHKFKDEELYYRFADDEVRKGGSLPDDVSSWAQFLPSYDYERGSLQPKFPEVIIT